MIISSYAILSIVLSGVNLILKLIELACRTLGDSVDIEILEAHHRHKIDAPSGTALTTAERISASSSEWNPSSTSNHVLDGARGGITKDGVSIHSVRMEGMVAHQDVIFGTEGQTLTIRQDSYDRSSFMPGVLLAVKKVGDFPGITLGLEPLLNL